MSSGSFRACCELACLLHSQVPFQPSLKPLELLRVVAARTDRLKQAKAEADKEVKAYKKQREEQYQKRISDVIHKR